MATIIGTDGVRLISGDAIVFDFSKTHSSTFRGCGHIHVKDDGNYYILHDISDYNGVRPSAEYMYGHGYSYWVDKSEVPVFLYKRPDAPSTDVCYLDCVGRLLKHGDWVTFQRGNITVVKARVCISGETMWVCSDVVGGNDKAPDKFGFSKSRTLGAPPYYSGKEDVYNLMKVSNSTDKSPITRPAVSWSVEDAEAKLDKKASKPSYEIGELNLCTKLLS